jgi:hypothetical protein
MFYDLCSVILLQLIIFICNIIYGFVVICSIYRAIN